MSITGSNSIETYVKGVCRSEMSVTSGRRPTAGSDCTSVWSNSSVRSFVRDRRESGKIEMWLFERER